MVQAHQMALDGIAPNRWVKERGTGATETATEDYNTAGIEQQSDSTSRPNGQNSSSGRDSDRKGVTKKAKMEDRML